MTPAQRRAGGGATIRSHHLEPRRDALSKLWNVRHHAHHPPLLSERFEHRDGLVERLLVERAEALVDEERLHANASGPRLHHGVREHDTDTKQQHRAEERTRAAVVRLGNNLIDNFEEELA